MKKLFFLTLFFGNLLNINSQNTFPDNGDVGIGTAFPKAKLHLNGDFYANMGEGFRIFGDGNYFATYQDAIVFQMEDTNSSNGVTDGGFVFRGYSTDDEIASDEWMVIKTGGKVGIGTTEPLGKLDVTGFTYLRAAPTHSVVSEQLRIGRSDQNIRYHSIYSNNTGSSATNYLDFRIHTGGSDLTEQNSVMTLLGNGNVGIGTTTPETSLHIESDSDSQIKLRSTSSDTNVGISFQGQRATSSAFSSHYIGTDRESHFDLKINADEHLKFQTNGVDRMTISGAGNVGIGTTDTHSYKLAVAGTQGIIAEKVTVKAYDNGNGWPDYVFDTDYNLPTLQEVEKHIKEKGHLENIPSAVAMKASDGIDLGAMNTKLLQKIEELTLYTIQQQKEIEKEKEERRNLEKKFEERIKKMEALLQK